MNKMQKTKQKEQIVFQGLWGYYPCSYETYKKLKYLHKIYWKTLTNYHTYWRWSRKTVHQHGEAPKFNAFFVHNKCWYKSKKNNGKYGIICYPHSVKDHNIVILYQQARYPSESIEDVDVFSKKNIGEIDYYFAKAMKEELFIS